MKDWYTVPAEYGGRTFSFPRRMFIEYLWRSQGHAGLVWYVNRMSRRALKNVVKIGKVFDKLTDELGRTASAFDGFTEAMREAASEGPWESANGD